MVIRLFWYCWCFWILVTLGLGGCSISKRCWYFVVVDILGVLIVLDFRILNYLFWGGASLWFWDHYYYCARCTGHAVATPSWPWGRPCAAPPPSGEASDEARHSKTLKGNAPACTRPMAKSHPPAPFPPGLRRSAPQPGSSFLYINRV